MNTQREQRHEEVSSESARILERGCDHVTRAVQEAWRRARLETPAPSPCANLLLGVASARHVTNPRGLSGGHTVYEIRVLVPGQLDSCPCTIERRFCQFQLLHRALLSELGASALRGTSLPRSLPAALSLLPLPPPAPRCLQLYLRALCALPTVRASRRFQEFLWLEETARGHACLRGGAYAEAASLLRSASLLQERAAWVAADRAHSAPTLSALAVCARDMGRPRDALGYCERAIQALSGGGGVDGVRTVVGGRARPLRQRYPELWAPLLRARARLHWELGETDAMDEREDKNVGVDGSGDPRSLKEVVIAQYLR